ncbi:CHAP domain-containing protein [Enterobacter sp. RHBSTW-00901]|uniref:CHAP domain-containing protein n=1 Tax=Enterobacter sp. RHBSTW-00901 TaxID=2742669 RepID=UPI0015F3DB38|nr:CHAP domain-containing protein [Enterobacter sp. RHBSTW-00901]MBA7854357.1 CHAP domain-containing protein [Enterobacter sp. RHBSTW-00901]
MWSAYKAVAYARQNAGQHSQKRCAEFVSNAIRAGGANIHNTHYAKDMDHNLIMAGFHKVYGDPIKGDIAVIQATAHHPYGHTCIYGGSDVWYSDFIQHSMYPGAEYREVKPAYEIYRHN